MGSKVPFWQNGKFSKMALLNWCMKFKLERDEASSPGAVFIGSCACAANATAATVLPDLYW